MSTSYFEALDPRFSTFIIPVCQLERLYSGTRWAEGPVYFADGRFLVFSDIPNNRMLKWDEQSGHVDVFRYPSNFSNGNTRDREGRLISCEHGTRRVTRTEYDGSITLLADNYRGKRLNSPNDVVVSSDGAVWFTDPLYGILTDYEGHKAESEIGARNVYRLDPLSGELSVVADDFDMPNGLAFSADEKTLYVADSGRSHGRDKPHHIWKFAVGAGGKLTSQGVLADIDPGIPDGIRLDIDRNIWVSAGDGVHCYADTGELLGKILIPEPVANVTFGGPKFNRLFITASSSLYAVYLNTRAASAK
ncbi:MAG: SMP-30/gluconolactonase/LRE family protein [Microvirga sp.]|nr:SMP-30/gluconolactonase/LRE family protein [Microvirga sp.]